MTEQRTLRPGLGSNSTAVVRRWRRPSRPRPQSDRPSSLTAVGLASLAVEVASASGVARPEALVNTNAAPWTWPPGCLAGCADHDGVPRDPDRRTELVPIVGRRFLRQLRGLGLRYGPTAGRLVAAHTPLRRRGTWGRRAYRRRWYGPRWPPTSRVRRRGYSRWRESLRRSAEQPGNRCSSSGLVVVNTSTVPWVFVPLGCFQVPRCLRAHRRLLCGRVAQIATEKPSSLLAPRVGSVSSAVWVAFAHPAAGLWNTYTAPLSACECAAWYGAPTTTVWPEVATDQPNWSPLPRAPPAPAPMCRRLPTPVTRACPACSTNGSICSG